MSPRLLLFVFASNARKWILDFFKKGKRKPNIRLLQKDPNTEGGLCTIFPKSHETTVSCSLPPSLFRSSFPLLFSRVISAAPMLAFGLHSTQKIEEKENGCPGHRHKNGPFHKIPFFVPLKKERNRQAIDFARQKTKEWKMKGEGRGGGQKWVRNAKRVSSSILSPSPSPRTVVLTPEERREEREGG